MYNNILPKGRYNYLPLVFLLILGFESCIVDGPKDIHAYYFPVDHLKGGKVYEYRPVGNDTVAPYYWYYNTLTPDPRQTDQKGTFLTGTYYDANLEIRQLVKEEKVGNGMLLDQAFLYPRQGVQTPFEILGNNVFPFEVADTSAIYLYKVKFREPADSSSMTTLIRNRRYLGQTRYTFKGQNIDAVEFEVRERLENDGNGRWQYEYNGKEIYGKGIGLVYTRKDLGKMVLEYSLYDIYDMSELEKKLKH